MCEFILHHAKKAATGKVEPEKICIVCEVNVHADALLPLFHENNKKLAIAWTHSDCMADYYR